MAHAAGTSTRTHRLIGLLAALLLAAATALAFGRVFLGTVTTMQLLASAVAAAGLAVALERRSLLLSTLASAVGLAIAIGLIVFPDSTWYGLPTAHTLRAALDAAGLVGEQARIQIAPAEPIGPLLLAGLVSLWASVFSAHALAFRAGSPLLGLIPPVALVAFADTVLEESVKPLYGVLFLAAALLVVFADGLARVQGWGPVWSSARRGVVASAGRGARRLGLTALGAAFLAPIVVPGFGSSGVVDLGSPAEGPVAIDPFVSIQHSLTEQTPVEVLRVTASHPGYLRLLSLPDFDGVFWKQSSPQEGDVIGPGDPIPAIPGRTGLTERVLVDVTADLAQLWVPVPYPIASIQMPGRTVRFNAETGTTFVDHPMERGERYTVTASLLRPTADDLRSSRTAAPLENGRYLYTPAGLGEVAEIAREWTDGADNAFDKAMAIQEHLRNTAEFRYTVDTPLRGGTRSILDFLTVSKAGFCQQFSTAMAVMLRKVGVQSRVVVGFAVGDRVPDSQQYSVQTDTAHSWVEAYFPDWGWMPFEPTPSRVNPVTTAYLEPVPPCEGPTCPGGLGGTPGEGAFQNGPGADQRERIENDPRATGPRGAVGRAGTIEAPPEEQGLARIALLVGLGLAAIALLLVPPARALRRRIVLRRAAAEPRRLILVTYEQFVERAAGLGLGRGPGETLEEYRRKVMETGYLSDGHLDRLTVLATSAAYSRREPDGGNAQEAGDAAAVAIREIKRAVGPARWLVGLYRRP